MIRELIEAYQFIKQKRRFIPEAQDEEYWTEEDSRAYLHFISTNTGEKFKLRLNNAIYYSAMRACAEDGNDYSRGIARGLQLMAVELDKNLPAATPQSSETQTSELPTFGVVELADSAI